MTTIIRVEHPYDGLGIWNTDAIPFFPEDDEHRAIAARHQNPNFPNPKQEGLKFTHKHFSAYKSIEQIQKWIMPEEFKWLISKGFKIYALDVSEYQAGEYQVIYKKEHILQQKDISSLFQ